MSTFKVDLEINQGSNFSKLVTWKTGEALTPVDLTGCQARMQVRQKVESPAVLLDFSTTAGNIVLGGALGTVKYAIMSATQTAAIAWTKGVYDLEIVFADGTVQRKISGNVTISLEVTRV